MENLPEGYGIAEVIELHVPQLEGELTPGGDSTKIALIFIKNVEKMSPADVTKNKGHSAILSGCI